MDPVTRAHVTGKVDMDVVGFMELRQVVQSFCNLIASTGKGGAVPMDIGSIASVAAGSVHPDGTVSEDVEQQQQWQQQQPP